MVYAKYGKRVFDAVGGVVLCVGLSPLIAVIATIVRVVDGRPVLFRQKRIGRHDERFELLKFRTMPVASSELPSAAAGCLSVTRAGRLLRRTSLDELPQLANIVMGDMSFVGPRPALASQVELCKMRRASGVQRCRPGVTGLAQLNSYDGMPDEEKARWDELYARNVTFWADLKILARTVGYLRRPPPRY